MQSGFFSAIDGEPHAERTRAILRTHPEVRRLFGRNPWTALIMIAVVALQTTIAGLLGTLPQSRWWMALILAYCVGAFANHCLFVIIHDATHNLIFRSRTLNRLILVLADLPNVLAVAAAFRAHHLEHHRSQGDYDRDADLPSSWEARLAGNKWYGKILWLSLFPVFQSLRALRIRDVNWLDHWAALNIIASTVYSIGIFMLFGWIALLYLFASFWFSISIHPLGARWVQEHYTLDPSQETFSYYGILNYPALNVGYHNEHHDFPSIPWNRLPKLRATAPEFYDDLRSHGSWAKLLIIFILNPEYCLFSRVTRYCAPKPADNTATTPFPAAQP
jgi:sphingolipid 4-desaturase/C4-monooxygenase